MNQESENNAFDLGSFSLSSDEVKVLIARELKAKFSSSSLDDEKIARLSSAILGAIANVVNNSEIEEVRNAAKE